MLERCAVGPTNTRPAHFLRLGLHVQMTIQQLQATHITVYMLAIKNPFQCTCYCLELKCQ